MPWIYDYLKDIGFPLANIQRMRDDKVMELLELNYKIAIYARGWVLIICP